MTPEVREKLDALNAALEAPTAPKDIYDVDAIAALINRFAEGLLPDRPRHYDTAKGIVETYARAVIAELATKSLKSSGPPVVHAMKNVYAG